ncbi:hypothetical protein BU26DRAFT_524487 [Trematosphaeria pertusa]|uniref:Uncharacterized protein n=1 Tax=Trematosphaeria pertusa TaxID=390896 RepID=A0A6A6HWD4_9PLEO|nr:uncharacterized protein BU26DRAFT_524487 [Trematosphaeria pertusa]KAF2242347.1 hypothetical protein BU26DRAFT_524487 [Trematosphaeria pertusa]
MPLFLRLSYVSCLDAISLSFLALGYACKFSTLQDYEVETYTKKFIYALFMSFFRSKTTQEPPSVRNLPIGNPQPIRDPSAAEATPVSQPSNASPLEDKDFLPQPLQIGRSATGGSTRSRDPYRYSIQSGGKTGAAITSLAEISPFFAKASPSLRPLQQRGELNRTPSLDTKRCSVGPDNALRSNPSSPPSSQPSGSNRPFETPTLPPPVHTTRTAPPYPISGYYEDIPLETEGSRNGEDWPKYCSREISNPSLVEDFFAKEYTAPNLRESRTPAQGHYKHTASSIYARHNYRNPISTWQGDPSTRSNSMPSSTSRKIICACKVCLVVVLLGLVVISSLTFKKVLNLDAKFDLAIPSNITADSTLSPVQMTTSSMTGMHASATMTGTPLTMTETAVTRSLDRSERTGPPTSANSNYPHFAKPSAGFTGTLSLPGALSTTPPETIIDISDAEGEDTDPYTIEVVAPRNYPNTESLALTTDIYTPTMTASPSHTAMSSSTTALLASVVTLLPAIPQVEAVSPGNSRFADVRNSRATRSCSSIWRVCCTIGRWYLRISQVWMHINLLYTLLFILLCFGLAIYAFHKLHEFWGWLKDPLGATKAEIKNFFNDTMGEAKEVFDKITGTVSKETMEWVDNATDKVEKEMKEGLGEVKELVEKIKPDLGEAQNTVEDVVENLNPLNWRRRVEPWPETIVVSRTVAEGSSAGPTPTKTSNVPEVSILSLAKKDTAATSAGAPQSENWFLRGMKFISKSLFKGFWKSQTTWILMGLAILSLVSLALVVFAVLTTSKILKFEGKISDVKDAAINYVKTQVEPAISQIHDVLEKVPGKPEIAGWKREDGNGDRLGQAWRATTTTTESIGDVGKVKTVAPGPGARELTAMATETEEMGVAETGTPPVRRQMQQNAAQRIYPVLLSWDGWKRWVYKLRSSDADEGALELSITSTAIPARPTLTTTTLDDSNVVEHPISRASMNVAAPKITRAWATKRYMTPRADPSPGSQLGVLPPHPKLTPPAHWTIPMLTYTTQANSAAYTPRTVPTSANPHPPAWTGAHLLRDWPDNYPFPIPPGYVAPNIVPKAPQVGHLTYFNPGTGACGLPDMAPNELAVAISWVIFDMGKEIGGSVLQSGFEGTVSNGLITDGKSVFCNRGMRIWMGEGEGRVEQRFVVRDRCTACNVTHLDVQPGVFANYWAADPPGRISATWEWLEGAPTGVP